MRLAVNIAHRQGAFELKARFEAGAGLTALFGPSGSGKTTLVNIVAGLVRPETGRIVAGDAVWFDSTRGVMVPTHRRRLGYVFQEGRLFPHLTVRQNLLYGRWFTPSARRRESLDRVVALLGIGHLLARQPGLLSGGEKSRVAIGRALMASPDLLLMDEPLAALDAERKAEIIPYIERLRDEAGIPILYVSHAVEEVARLATTIVTLSDGRITGIGPAAEMLSRPRTYTEEDASEAASLLEMTVVAHDRADALTRLASAGGTTVRIPLIAAQPGSRLRVRVRARDVMIATEKPEGLSALNILPAQVESVVEDRGACDIVLATGTDRLVARLTAHSTRRLALAAGKPVYAVIKSVSFDRHTAFAQAGGGIEPA